jgi:hypothetical protein
MSTPDLAASGAATPDDAASVSQPAASPHRPGRHRRASPWPRRIRSAIPVAAVTAFITTAVVANTLTAHLGLIAVGFGLTATAGTWTAGLTLTLRDVVHDTWGRAGVFAAIAAAALASAGTAGPRLAIASGVAFAASELADLTVYTPLRRHGWARAVLASNTVGAVVDSLIFLTLAGFPTAAMPGQLVAKATATLAVVIPVVAVRAVLRHRIRSGPESAHAARLVADPRAGEPWGNDLHHVQWSAWIRS